MLEGGNVDVDCKLGDSTSEAGRTLDFVKDVLKFMIGIAVEKCEDQNKSKRGKIVFSEQQQMRLEQVFSETRLLSGGEKDNLSDGSVGDGFKTGGKLVSLEEESRGQGSGAKS